MKTLKELISIFFYSFIDLLYFGCTFVQNSEWTITNSEYPKLCLIKKIYSWDDEKHMWSYQNFFFCKCYFFKCYFCKRLAKVKRDHWMSKKRDILLKGFHGLCVLWKYVFTSVCYYNMFTSVCYNNMFSPLCAIAYNNMFSSRCAIIICFHLCGLCVL